MGYGQKARIRAERVCRRLSDTPEKPGEEWGPSFSDTRRRGTEDTPCRAHSRTQGGSGLRSRHAGGGAEENRLKCAARRSRCPPETARWGDSPRSQGRWESQRICRRGDGAMPVIGTSSAAEAVSTPLSDVGMTRKGEAPTCRSQARKGAHDRGRITEEPCARKPASTVLKQRRGERSLRRL